MCPTSALPPFNLFDSPLYLRTQKASNFSAFLVFVLNKHLAPLTVPIIFGNALSEITPVALLMHAHQAKIANNDFIIFIVVTVQTYIADYIVINFILDKPDQCIRIAFIYKLRFSIFTELFFLHFRLNWLHSFDLCLDSVLAIDLSDWPLSFWWKSLLLHLIQRFHLNVLICNLILLLNEILLLNTIWFNNWGILLLKLICILEILLHDLLIELICLWQFKICLFFERLWLLVNTFKVACLLLFELIVLFKLLFFHFIS